MSDVQSQLNGYDRVSRPLTSTIGADDRGEIEITARCAERVEFRNRGRARRSIDEKSGDTRACHHSVRLFYWKWIPVVCSRI